MYRYSLNGVEDIVISEGSAAREERDGVAPAAAPPKKKPAAKTPAAKKPVAKKK